jgi:hypothetical protein
MISPGTLFLPGISNWDSEIVDRRRPRLFVPGLASMSLSFQYLHLVKLCRAYVPYDDVFMLLYSYFCCTTSALPL